MNQKQYFRISHLKDIAKRANFPRLVSAGGIQYRQGAKNPETGHRVEGGSVRPDGGFRVEHHETGPL
jgi:hypothetical protein